MITALPCPLLMNLNVVLDTGNAFHIRDKPKSHERVLEENRERELRPETRASVLCVLACEEVE